MQKLSNRLRATENPSDISGVRRDILSLFAGATILGGLLLLLTDLLVLRLPAGPDRQLWLIYLLLMPLVALGWLAFLYSYLRPIADLAQVTASGASPTPEMLQRARTLAFQAPIFFLLIPAILAFMASALLDLFGVLFVENYAFAEYQIKSALVTIIVLALCLITSVVSRRILAPVLFFTSGRAEDIGPRINLRTRQIVATFLVSFIIIAFMGMVGYNMVLRGTHYGLQEKYLLLGETLAGPMGNRLSDAELNAYVATLAWDDARAFIIDPRRGDLVTELPDEYGPIHSLAGTIAPRLLTAETRLGPVRAPGGEIIFTDLNRESEAWWLGIFYYGRPLQVPIVRDSVMILSGFVALMALVIYATSHYLSEDFTREIQYVTGRLIELTEDPDVSFEKLTVLSLDEVGDLVVAFNALLEKVKQQQGRMARDKSELRALLEVTRDIGFILDADQLLAQIIRSLERVFGYTDTAIFLLDDKTAEVYVAAYPKHLQPRLTARRWPIKPESVVGSVAQSGQPVLKSAGDTWESCLPWPSGVRSELAVPMVVGRVVMGVFDIVSAEPDAYTEEDARVISAVADQAALALQNARLYREVAEQRQTFAALVQLAKTVTSTLNLQQVLALALEHLEQVMAYDTASILLLDGDRLTIAAERGFDDEDDRIGKTYFLEEKPLGYDVILSQQVRVVADVQALPKWGANQSETARERTVRAWIGAPLVVDDMSLGLLAVDKFEPDFYSDKDGHLTTAFADQIAIAVQNARSYGAAQERAKEMSLLQDVSQRISALMLLEVNALLAEIAQRIIDTFHYQFVSIHLLDRETGVLEFAAQHGVVERDIPQGLLCLDGAGIVPWVANHGVPLLIPDVTRDARYVAVADNIRSELAVPLIVNDEVVGVFNLESEHVAAFDEYDVQLMTALANQISVALQNARLFHDVRDQATQLEILQEVSQKISSILDIDQLLNEVCNAVAEAFGYQHVAILLADNTAHELYFGAQVGYDQDVSDIRLAIYGQEGVVTEAAATLEPVLVPDVTQNPRYISALDSVRSELAIPLIAGERLVGVFNLESDRLRGFEAENVRLMTALGQQITGALESARLFQSVREQARELAQMASSLADEKSKLDAILHNIADGLIVTNPEGDIMLVNSAFEYMFERAATTLVGRALADVLQERDLARIIDSARHNDAVSYASEIRRPDGRTLKAASVGIRDAGRFLGVATVVRDITHEKEVDRMKTEFISAVSHELRTPLTSVLGFAKLISRTFEKDVYPNIVDDNRRTTRAARRIRNNLGIIVTEGERLTRLINDVLDISRMEAGNVDWQDRAFDLVETLHHVVERMQPQIAEAGLEFRVEMLESPVRLRADPNRVRQVLFNLLSNAVKFTKTGEIVLKARVLAPGEVVGGWEAPESVGGGILCSVSDTGIGIPPEELPRLFHRFQQVVSDTLTGKPTGTGLGLAISREIVTHYGGNIWAESTPDEGATFYFTLPLQPVERVDEAVQPVISTARPHPSAPDDVTPLVLIVDDEPHIRTLLAQELEGHGYKTLTASEGAAAITLARQHTPRPDLILLDIMMPGISGFDVTRILKDDPLTGNIPILILSIVEERERGLALGADEYLIKPLEIQTVLDTVSALISQVPQRPKAVVTGKARTALEGITCLLREQGFEVVEAYDPRGGISTTMQVKPDRIILDGLISKLNAAEVIKALRFQEHERAYIIIVLAGSGQELADADSDVP